jgi:hypothetical protein
MSDIRQIVAIGLLTQHDLNLLGYEFDRAIPVDQTPRFEELLRAIDDADRDFRARTSRERG